MGSENSCFSELDESAQCRRRMREYMQDYRDRRVDPVAEEGEFPSKGRNRELTLLFVTLN